MKHITRTAALVLMAAVLSVNICADKFTPSVEQKEAPTIVAPKTEHKVDGKPALVVKDKKGEVIAADKVETVKVTPVSSFKKKAEDKKDDTKTTEPTEPLTKEEAAIQESLEKAYTEIVEAKSLDVIAPELPNVMKDLKIETKVEDLVVQDLINITLPEEMAKALEVEGNTIDMTFEMKIEEGKQLIVMVQGADGKWVVIAGDAIVVNDDGTVTIAFNVVGNVAFVIA